ncbi:unnamed protein product [Closterium sp. Naga37s-1]|nr:unnamed protein product [Closterium sp. Naga37s-1]
MAPERKGSLKTSSDAFQGLYKGADILLLRYLFPKPEDISLEALIPTIGFFVLGGVKATPLIVAGSSVNTVGGVWYTYAKYKAKNAQQAERAEQVKAHSSPRMSEDKV